ncbi:hypothetical protein V3C99_010779 [Haemonchus contortus]
MIGHVVGMLLRSAGLVVFFFLFHAPKAITADELSCDFRRPCCWHSLDETTKWQIRSGRSININEFRRTFLVGRSRLPPVGNYLLQSRRRGQSAFGSCPFCSSDGKVIVQYRHWQSPTSRLKLCWRPVGQEVVRNENCHLVEPSRQSQVISQSMTVPKGINVQVLFVMEKTDGGANAVVMIDRIMMNVRKCMAAEQKTEVLSQTATIVLPSSSLGSENSHPLSSSSGISSPAANSRIELAQLALIDDRVRAKLAEREDSKKLVRQSVHEADSIKSKERKSGEVKSKEIDRPGRSTERLASTAEVMSPAGLLSAYPKRRAFVQPKRGIPDMEHSKELVGASVPPMPPPSPLAKPEEFDPLTDLLGKELVNFLDPNYVTKDDEEEPDYVDQDLETSTKQARVIVRPINRPSNTIVQTPTQVQTPSPLHVFNRPFSLTPPSPCHTYGGCLFDRSMCSYVHPQEVPYSNYFMRVKVGYSHFVRARVSPGTTSVLETETNMLEPHSVFFDALEWQSGTRLIGCCTNRVGIRQCPFATPVEAGVLLWQSASFDCPALTVKISFICENFGVEDGECGLDSVRLHRLSDTFLLEPCQKNVLSSL